MGSADVVPGVSGGTIAFITGIYQELLDSISSINPTTLSLLIKGQFKSFWKAVNGSFFLALLAGIALSVITLASILSEIVNNPNETKEKILLWSFFLGLIVASSIYMGKQIKQWNQATAIGLVTGIGVAFTITVISPAAGMDAYWYIFLSGFIAICAMILPGISGSFILLLMGAYPLILGSIGHFIEGLKEGNMDILLENGTVLGIFAIGCIAGLLSFARVVSYLFKRSPQITLAVLTGFLIGSLNKVWPWKETLEFRTNSHGESIPYLQTNLLPNEYLAAHGESHLTLAIWATAIGFGLVFLIEWMGSRMNRS